jgi:hypothetical protein
MAAGCNPPVGGNQSDATVAAGTLTVDCATPQFVGSFSDGLGNPMISCCANGSLTITVTA